ncbi:MAG: cellulase family glycosylhydrolase [Bacteroidales bacterium]|nr:cellulase family glycosylhydrolase [Bacteroidales bacterium]
MKKYSNHTLNVWQLVKMIKKRTFIVWHAACIFLFSLFLSGCNQSPKVNNFPPLFPFLISYDGPDNASSMSHLIDTPAGKHGFIRVENGRFVNDAGPVRLNATNLTGPANFPTHGQADSLAARLARFGINCVRLHYMDSPYGNFLHREEPGIIAEDSKTQRNLDPSQMDKLDYLISVFKKRGIYVDINLHVARWWDDRDGFSGKDKRPAFDKGLDNFEPRMIELQKEYARKLLTHVNPFTGLAYTEDPCVAVVEINNENALFNQYHGGAIDQLPDPYASEFRWQWNKWLHNKYKTTAGLIKSWKSDTTTIGRNINSKNKSVQQIFLDGSMSIENGTIPTIKAGSVVLSQAKKDFYQFLVDTEHAYWFGFYNFLKKDLKVRSVISGTQLGYSPPSVQAELDYIDSHSYWCHPSPVNPDWRIVNKSMVNSMTCIQGLAAQRIMGKPYTVSEYNHPFPIQYGAEGQPMLRAYGRFQGWDGVFEYTYNHQSDFEPEDNNYFFSIIARTDVLAHLQACAAIFLRGDVREGKSTIAAPIDYSRYFDNLIKTNQVGANIKTAGFDIRQTMLHKTVVDLTGKSGTDTASVEKIPSAQKIFISDTDELTWNIEQADAGYFTVNTPNTKLFTGFPKNRKIILDNVTLAIGKTRLGWATVSLVSRNATGFGESGNPSSILLAATGISENKDMSIESFNDDKIILSKWGEGPVYVEGVPAEVTLPADRDKTKCYSLDPSGNRMKEIPVGKAKGGGSKIVLKPEYETIWYEIEIQ